MTISYRWAAYSAFAGVATVGIGCLIALGFGAPSRQVVSVDRTVMHVQLDKVVIALPAAENGQYEQLRTRLRWVQTRMGKEQLPTLDLDSRMLLAKSAARKARLHEVGLGFEDVYGLINAETSWVPRTGASKNGTPNLGIAQFEPATAKALGMRNPEDPVEAVHVAALHMKDAAVWSADRIDGLKLDAGERAAKLREGVSIYYNLSTRGRNLWNGNNTDKLPRETQLHIQNVRAGRQQAYLLDAQLRVGAYGRGPQPAVAHAIAQNV